MNDSFIISINYKNKPLDFEARLLQFAYSYKIEVIINDSKLHFERDDERQLRATIEPDKEGKIANDIEPALVAAIAAKIEEILD